MIVSVYNEKGGTGKTIIAVNLALLLKCRLATNERGPTLVRAILKKGQLVELGDRQDFPKMNPGKHCIFDFAGKPDWRLPGALKRSDLVIIPTRNDASTMQKTTECVQEVKQYTNKIIILANSISVPRRGEKVDQNFEDIKETIGPHHPEIPILQMKYSPSIEDVYANCVSLQELHDEAGPLGRYHIKTPLNKFKEILERI